MLTKMYVFMSACTGGELDDHNTGALHDTLNNQRWVWEPLKGVYKGAEEDSVVVQVDDFSDVGSLVRIAEQYNQESIMIRDARGKCFLYYLNDRRMESIGLMFQTDIKPTTDSYSMNMSGLYFYTL
ncbi:hypothetical protein BN110_022 [Yersinia phage phiR8-01]|uniref:Uncharacterized protein n=1 Tax=Yersinia phage phiR8-01 TaxID=1206556 RepID=I7LEA3_9CAUD|nr:SAM-dependent methyltransferase [Yersinia phage phiR8-01]CCI88392.2 hypothetical protein BN110_022 [Yersinia phage phiR8-01]